MTITKAVAELSRTLRSIPGFVRVFADGDTIVLVTFSGGGGLRSWAGHPVRNERGSR